MWRFNSFLHQHHVDHVLLLCLWNTHDHRHAPARRPSYIKLCPIERTWPLITSGHVYTKHAASWRYKPIKALRDTGGEADAFRIVFLSFYAQFMPNWWDSSATCGGSETNKYQAHCGSLDALLRLTTQRSQLFKGSIVPKSSSEGRGSSWENQIKMTTKWLNLTDEPCKAILCLHFHGYLKELKPIAAWKVENQCKSQ